MRPLFALVFSVMFGSSAAAQPDFRDARTAWGRVLAEHVTDTGQVDFACLEKNRSDLDVYIDYVARVSPHSHPQAFPTRAHQLAYHINTYNALAMHNVVDFGIPHALEGFFYRLRFFYLRKQRLGGRKISLYQYENDVIRPCREPRVHFALNCMAVSCPRLPRAPFLPERLDADLDRLTREFFADPRNLQIEHDRERIRVSEILSFYEEDFLLHNESLAGYVDQFVPDSIPASYDTVFFDYDWTVNAANGAPCGPVR